MLSNSCLVEMFKCFSSHTPAHFPAKSISSTLCAQLQTDRCFHPPKSYPVLHWNSVTDKSLGDACGQTSSPIHNLACLSHCRLPLWKPVVLGCTSKLLAVMATACVMTLFLIRTEKDKHCLLCSKPSFCFWVSLKMRVKGYNAWRLSSIISYVHVICTSKGKGITEDERIRNKWFLKGQVMPYCSQKFVCAHTCTHTSTHTQIGL